MTLVVRALSPQSAPGVSTQTPPSGGLVAPRRRSGSRLIWPPFATSVGQECVEPFSLGSLAVECGEPFDIEQALVVVNSIEPFLLSGAADMTCEEPFLLGEGILVGTVEPFSILSAMDARLGTGSMAAPKLGWRDRSA